MNGVKVQGFCLLGKLELAGGRAVLGGNAHFQVLFGRVAQTFTEQFCKFCGVLCFFKSGGLPVFGNFGVALSCGNASHGEVHTDFGALALKVGAQTLDDLFGSALGNAQHVLGSPVKFVLYDLNKFFARDFATGALIGTDVGFNDFSANGASPFFHGQNSFLKVIFFNNLF